MNKVYLFFALLISINSTSGNEIFKEKVGLMGSNFEITVIAENKAQADIFIAKAVNEIKRIENLISSWDPKSQTSAINKNAGINPVKVDLELFQLIERSIAISKLTDGAFDISYASMDRIWKFDGTVTQIPDQVIILQSIAKVGFENIVLDKENSSVFLKKEGMKIGFGGIGKGYAADKAKALLEKIGVKGGIINASGDMNTWGQKPDGKDWEVAITNPMDKSKSFGRFPLNEGSVVTSGDYEKFVILNNERYSHIINPKTGMPAKGIISVTVFAPKAELADALATSVFVMGIEAGIDRINQLPNIECIIVSENGSLYTSKNIKIDS